MDLAPDVLLCLVKKEIFVGGKIETVVLDCWVTDSVECCCVGFVPHFLFARNCDSLNGLLAQVTESFDDHYLSPAILEKVYHNYGFCHATIFDQNNSSLVHVEDQVAMITV